MKTDKSLYWEVLEAHKWDELHDYKNQPRKVIDAFGEELWRKAWEYADDLFSLLYKDVNEYEKFAGRCGQYGGDDSFGDMLWHAIGKGKDYYHKVLENPKLLDDLNYTECFAYCKQVV
jgi:hypothetical protein